MRDFPSTNSAKGLVLCTKPETHTNSSSPGRNGRHFWQMTIWYAFSWMKMIEFRFECHWNLLPGVQLTTNIGSGNGLAPNRSQAIIWNNNALQGRHNGRDSVSNHQPRDCFLNCLSRHRSKKTSKLRVTGLCVGHSPEAGEFPAQMASNAEMFPFDDVILG